MPKVKESIAMFRISRNFFILSLLLLLMAANSISGQRRRPSQPAQIPQTPPAKESDLSRVLQWRAIGPFRGGRVTAVAGVASQPGVFYFGGTGSGVWKTADGGINWEPVSDG